MIGKVFAFIKKQIFLLPIVERWFPFMRTSIMKYPTGLAIRYVAYQFNEVIENHLFDKYCDILYIEYITTRTMLLCEYQEWVKRGMQWLLDSINVILLEDTLEQSITAFREETRAGFAEMRDAHNDLREEMRDAHNDLREEMRAGFNELRAQIQPQIQFEQMLTAEDLRHE